MIDKYDAVSGECWKMMLFGNDEVLESGDTTSRGENCMAACTAKAAQAAPFLQFP